MVSWTHPNPYPQNGISVGSAVLAQLVVVCDKQKEHAAYEAVAASHLCTTCMRCGLIAGYINVSVLQPRLIKQRQERKMCVRGAFRYLSVRLPVLPQMEVLEPRVAR